MHSHAVVLHARQWTLQAHQQDAEAVRADVVDVVGSRFRVVKVIDNMRRVVKVRDQAIQVLVQIVGVLEHVSRYTSPVYCSCKPVRSVALLFVMVHVSASDR